MVNDSEREILGIFALQISILRNRDGSIDTLIECQNKHVPQEVVIMNLRGFANNLEGKFNKKFDG